MHLRCLACLVLLRQARWMSARLFELKPFLVGLVGFVLCSTPEHHHIKLLPAAAEDLPCTIYKLEAYAETSRSTTSNQTHSP